MGYQKGIAEQEQSPKIPQEVFNSMFPISHSICFRHASFFEWPCGKTKTELQSHLQFRCCFLILPVFYRPARHEQAVFS